MNKGLNDDLPNGERTRTTIGEPLWSGRRLGPKSSSSFPKLIARQVP